MGEVKGDAILVRGHYLPDTVLVGGIKVRKGGALYVPIGLINVPSTGIYNTGLYVKNLLNIGPLKLTVGPVQFRNVMMITWRGFQKHNYLHTFCHQNEVHNQFCIHI